jgi:hypothetical protein
MLPPCGDGTPGAAARLSLDSAQPGEDRMRQEVHAVLVAGAINLGRADAVAVRAGGLLSDAPYRPG